MWLSDRQVIRVGKFDWNATTSPDSARQIQADAFRVSCEINDHEALVVRDVRADDLDSLTIHVEHHITVCDKYPNLSGI